MLEHLPCVRVDAAPLRPPAISRNMDERAIRFELERQACQSLRQVLQLKLQQRRSREELVKQGIMPPLKSSTSFHEQRRNLERARTEDYLKRKIRSRPERSELIRMHILEGECHINPPVGPETSTEPSLQAKQLQLKKARLADDLNDKISHRPGPMELIHKNILPVHSSIKQAIIETQFPKASGDNSSCDEDSSYSLSPELPVSQESPLGLLSLPSPPETLAGSSVPSPPQVLPPAPPLPPASSPSLKLANGTAAPSAQRMAAITQIKFQPKPNSDRCAQRHKKPKDSKPKIKKLKYHQYIPPDQKGDKEPPPHLDSSYAKILQQQQLFLQLQILNQQQQHYNYHAILPAPPKAQTDQQPSSSSSSAPMASSSSSPNQPVAAAPSAAPSNLGGHSCQGSGTKAASSTLDEMKVAELKSELKMRSLPVSGTKNDLIERLRTYLEVNGGGDTTSSPTAGGTTGPGAEGARDSSKTAASSNNSKASQQQQQQQQLQCHQTSSSLIDVVGVASPQQLITCVSAVSPQRTSLTPSDHHSPGMRSPEETSFNTESLGEMLCLQPLPVNIKEEPKCSTPAPCQFSLQAASLQKHRLSIDSSAANNSTSTSTSMTTTPAPAVTMDKDQMLQEKDRQIEELTRMLRQKQRLVELLSMQLEHRKMGGQGPVLVRVKQEPPDKPDGSHSFGHPPLPRPPSSALPEMDVTTITVKQEAIEAGEVVSETQVTQFPDSHGLLQSSTQSQEAQMKQAQTRQKQQICLQQTTLQFAQQQAIQKLLLQQQQNLHNQHRTMQSHGQTAESQQKLSQQRKKKSHKQQLKQLQHQQAKHHQQQTQLKQQFVLKQQKSLLQQQQQQQQQQTKQLQQIQIHLKQQQVLIQQKQQEQQQSPQVTQTYLKQHSGPAPSLPLNSTPTLITDSNGNHFLITLTNRVAENQRADAPGSKAANQASLQRQQSTPAKLCVHSADQLPRADSQTRQNVHVGFVTQQTRNPHGGGAQASVAEPQQDVSQCLSAPPSLQPFFKDQESAPSGKNTSPPPSQTELCPGLDVLFSPLSPASVKTAASSPDNKDTEHEDDFIDIILQTGEMSTTFKPEPDFSQDPSSSSPPPSPFQLLLSPSIPPSHDGTPRSASSSSAQPDLGALTDDAEERRHLRSAGGGRLEDFLESTTGKPLLGVEPGSVLTLIDDLHSQMLCTPSILDHPPSPIDTSDIVEGEPRLDSMDWLDLTMGGVRADETPTLAPLGPQTPTSVFSTDFLDSYDLQTWDCL